MEDFNLAPLLPEIFLSIIAMGLLLVGAFNGNNATRIVSWAGCSGILITILVLLGIGWHKQTVLNGMFIIDEFSSFTKLLILIGSLGAIALSVRYIIDEGMERFEYPVLILFATIGMMFMVSSNNLLMLYMGLELQSLSLYVLASFHRNSTRSAEAGIKYFILGALSSGLLLFGISLIYGFTGSIDYTVIKHSLFIIDGASIGFTIGLVFLLAGIAFKISAAPFHMWTPDVYEGAPTSVTAFFAMVPKIAAMAVLMRLLFEPFASVADQWVQIIYFLSLFSMIVGAFAALVQEDIKRLLAYSSIGNMGYALIAIVANTPEGAGAVLLYILIYMIMTAGVFGAVLSMRRQGLAVTKINDLAGLSQTKPALAYVMFILMFSMAGIPPMAGFFGKLAVFNAAVAQEFYVLATIGVISSVISAYYYLRVVKAMFFDEPADKFDTSIPFARRVVMFVSIFFVICFVFKPSVFIQSSITAASSLFAG
ncbi:MAG: NADH-quinone oxidoreductase subunit N [Micavibrio sp. TMED27]|nr:NADH-quinone oxidoreductase subunit NuoN [Micavibrio sp.]OUT90108.1 MAG: NADH-quinone oxidoreductase subunit N [Micavibrio sp. TMED27]|tara:strand:+ start:6777 stop:8219 length:1443 start_codon:yes stop_codon:yes gene_type:complete